MTTSDDDYHAAARIARAYYRANADALADEASKTSIMAGKQGSFIRADGEDARRILRRVFLRHFRSGAATTAMRLTLEEMAAFPAMTANPHAGHFAWLAVVTDSTGRYSYAVAQESGFPDDPKIRAVTARSTAQLHACKMLVGDFMAGACGNA